MKGIPARILVVEDDEDTSFLLKKALSEAGYVVESCMTGSGIVEFRHAWPDLFILDKHLPTIDGLALAKFLRLHDATRDIPIIMISAYPIKAKAIQVGIDEFVAKPFCMDVFLKIVDRCIHSVHHGV